MLHENILIKLTANYIFVNKLLVLKSVNVKTSKINMTCRIAYVHVNLDAVDIMQALLIQLLTTGHKPRIHRSQSIRY